MFEVNRKEIRRRVSPDAIGPQNVNPRLATILATRGITDANDLQFSNRDLLHPGTLNDIDTAAAIISEHVMQGSGIRIVGDYDADGATSTALMLLMLRAYGASHVDFVVPDRFIHGYGLSPALVESFDDTPIALLITVDNGIASIEGVASAKARHMQIVVTDHHLPGDRLPSADAIVNPNASGDLFPSKNLSGVGVAFYVLSVTGRVLEKRGWFKKRPIPKISDYLDLVALGTYADLVALDQNNRILVNQGLKRIKAGRCRPGISALVDLSGKNQTQLIASDLGFQIAPRLNAAGRLEDMTIGINCLIAETDREAKVLAQKLDSINKERKTIEQHMTSDATSILDKIGSIGKDSNGICLYNREWHEGVVGLVASRLKEKWALPSVVFACGTSGQLKGSARSVKGVHIRDVLCDIDSGYPGLIQKFGGHAMAAGLSIGADSFAEFESAWGEVLSAHTASIRAANELLTDGALHDEFIDLDFIQELKSIVPWGQGFGEPLFDNVFQVLEQRLVGQIHLKLLLRSEQSNKVVNAIKFRFLDSPGASYQEFSRIHAVYRVDVNEYSGRIDPQLIIEHINPV